MKILKLISNFLFHISREKTSYLGDLFNVKNLLGVTLNLMIDMYIEEEKAAANILDGIKVNRFSKLSYVIKDSIKRNIVLFEKFYITVLNYLLYDCKIDDEKLKLFQHSTELVVKIQIYKDQDHMPEWLIFLIKLIFTSENIVLSLEALEYILDVLNMKNENDAIREIKLFLRQESLEYIISCGNKILIDSIEEKEKENNFSLTKAKINSICNKFKPIFEDETKRFDYSLKNK